MMFVIHFLVVLFGLTAGFVTGSIAKGVGAWFFLFILVVFERMLFNSFVRESEWELRAQMEREAKKRYLSPRQQW